MEISSKVVGNTVPEVNTTVTWRQSTNYAAAVGERHPAYYDDRRPEGLISPPMLATALTWPISSKLEEVIEDRSIPREVFLTQVHYFEHLIYHQALRPGDRLTIKGTVAGIQPQRAGTLFIMQYTAHDSQGQPVFTEYTGAILRGVRCADQGRGWNLPKWTEDLWEGPPVWEVGVPIDSLAPYIYDGCTDIIFAIHTSPTFAESVGLPGIILQGTATLAYAVREIVHREAEGDPSALKEISCRFTGMVRPGSQIKVRLTQRRDPYRAFMVINEQDEPALSRGVIRISTERR